MFGYDFRTTIAICRIENLACLRIRAYIDLYACGQEMKAENPFYFWAFSDHFPSSSMWRFSFVFMKISLFIHQ